MTKSQNTVSSTPANTRYLLIKQITAIYEDTKKISRIDIKSVLTVSIPPKIFYGYTTLRFAGVDVTKAA